MATTIGVLLAEACRSVLVTVAAVQILNPHPHLHVAQIAGGGHSVRVDQPAAYLEAVLPFLTTPAATNATQPRGRPGSD